MRLDNLKKRIELDLLALIDKCSSTGTMSNEENIEQLEKIYNELLDIQIYD